MHIILPSHNVILHFKTNMIKNALICIQTGRRDTVAGV